MKIVLRLILVAALVGLGFWLWTVLFPGPKKIIRRHLLELARTVSSSPGETDLTRLAAARNAAGFFATNVEVSVEAPHFTPRRSMDREEITQIVLFARSREGGLRVTFPDINVTVLPDKQSALAEVTVEARVAGEPDLVIQEMKFTLRKIDGQWLITRVESVQTLSRGAPLPAIYAVDGGRAAL